MNADESRGEQLKRLQQELDQNPESARAHLKLGTWHYRAGQHAKAEKLLRRAVEIEPDLYQAWGNLGGVRFALWDFAGSAEANQRAVECNPDGVQGHMVDNRLSIVES